MRIIRLLALLGILMAISPSTGRANVVRSAPQSNCIALSVTYEESGSCITLNMMYGCDCTPGLVPSCGSVGFCSVTACDSGFGLMIELFCT